MDVTADLFAPHSPEVLFAWVEDLGRYPQWLSIVPRAVAEPAHDRDRGPAWIIDLRGKFGPLSRSKRLRMVRTRIDAPRAVVFEREERDGQDHSAWVLRATVDPADGGSHLTMHLHYGGRLWEPLVERLLQLQRDGRAGGGRRTMGRRPRAIILAPTRELAQQIDRTVQPLARAVGLFTIAIVGGVPYQRQLTGLHRGADIVIGTPGRVLDLIAKGELDLSEMPVPLELCRKGRTRVDPQRGPSL